MSQCLKEKRQHAHVTDQNNQRQDTSFRFRPAPFFFIIIIIYVKPTLIHKLIHKSIDSLNQNVKKQQMFLFLETF